MTDKDAARIAKCVFTYADIMIRNLTKDPRNAADIAKAADYARIRRYAESGQVTAREALHALTAPD